MAITRQMGVFGHGRLRRRLAAAERAALAASVDDPSFDPAAVVKLARRQYEPVAGHGEGLKRLRELEARFGRWSLDRVTYGLQWFPGSARPLLLELDAPTFHIAGVERGADGRVERAVVRVGARVQGRAGDDSFTVKDRLVAFWVFHRPAGRRWELARVEPGPSGQHRLRGDPTGEAALVERLRTASVRELIEPPATSAIPYEIADNLPDDPVAALHDLSLVDDRFAMPVLETSVRDMVGRWERSAGDDRAPLEHVATREAIRALLGTGYVIRGAKVERVRPVRVWGLRVPPEVDVEVVVRCWRGRRDSVRGDVMRRHHWWRLAANPSPSLPWLLADADTKPLPARPRHRRSRARRHVSRR
jgi:hypothetical protein